MKTCKYDRVRDVRWSIVLFFSYQMHIQHKTRRHTEWWKEYGTLCAVPTAFAPFVMRCIDVNQTNFVSEMGWKKSPLILLLHLLKCRMRAQNCLDRTMHTTFFHTQAPNALRKKYTKSDFCRKSVLYDTRHPKSTFHAILFQCFTLISMFLFGVCLNIRSI